MIHLNSGDKKAVHTRGDRKKIYCKDTADDCSLEEGEVSSEFETISSDEISDFYSPENRDNRISITVENKKYHRKIKGEIRREPYPLLITIRPKSLSSDRDSKSDHSKHSIKKRKCGRMKYQERCSRNNSSDKEDSHRSKRRRSPYEHSHSSTVRKSKREDFCKSEARFRDSHRLKEDYCDRNRCAEYRRKRVPRSSSPLDSKKSMKESKRHLSNAARDSPRKNSKNESHHENSTRLPINEHKGVHISSEKRKNDDDWLTQNILEKKRKFSAEKRSSKERCFESEIAKIKSVSPEPKQKPKIEQPKSKNALEINIKLDTSNKAVEKPQINEKEQQKFEKETQEASSIPVISSYISSCSDGNFSIPLRNPGNNAVQFLPQYPVVGLDHLPLIPGPTGLPVHVTPTGELIPYDMDGRRIPIGPNGHYLPVDPSGRIFPHVISLGNLAIPIHMSEDGVLRLPNLEPVPYGPPNNFPINTDGNFIFIDPDSRPLFSCLNLPKHPPQWLTGAVSSKAKRTTQSKEHTPTTNTDESFDYKMSATQTETELTGNNCGKEKKKSGKKRRKVLKQTNEDVLVFNKSNNPEEDNNSSNMNLDSEDSTSTIIFQSVEDSDKEPLRMETNSDDSKSEIDIDDFFVKKNYFPICSESDPDDSIIQKITQALSTFNESDYDSFQSGRFVLNNLQPEPPQKSNEKDSPLWRNRIRLPFITPDDMNTTKKLPHSKINFKFSPTSTEKQKNISSMKPKEFSAQCDFTSQVIQSLSEKLGYMQLQVVQLKQCMLCLLETYMESENSSEK